MSRLNGYNQQAWSFSASNPFWMLLCGLISGSDAQSTSPTCLSARIPQCISCKLAVLTYRAIDGTTPGHLQYRSFRLSTLDRTCGSLSICIFTRALPPRENVRASEVVHGNAELDVGPIVLTWPNPTQNENEILNSTQPDPLLHNFWLSQTITTFQYCSKFFSITTTVATHTSSRSQSLCSQCYRSHYFTSTQQKTLFAFLAGSSSMPSTASAVSNQQE